MTYRNIQLYNRSRDFHNLILSQQGIVFDHIIWLSLVQLAWLWDDL